MKGRFNFKLSNFFNKSPKNNNGKPEDDRKKKEVKNLNDLLDGPPLINSSKNSSKISMRRSSFAVLIVFLIVLASCFGAFGGKLLDRYFFLKNQEYTPKEVHIEGDFCSSGEAVALKVFPSVVTIQTIIRDESVGIWDGFGLGPFSFFSFFGQDNSKDKKSKFDDDVIGQGIGSGVIFSCKNDNAYIMTNFHVIKSFLKHSEKSEIEVYFDGDVKNSKKAEVVGYQPALDVAVIKVPLNGKSVICADIGDSSKLNRGQEIFVLGSPAGLNYKGSISHGIVSGLDRKMQFEGIVDPVKTVQVDAPVNPGNSGGAVCDKNGKIVAMCVLKLVASSPADTGPMQGMGFCLPINSVMDEVNKIMNSPEVNNRRPLAMLGINMVTEEIEKLILSKYHLEGCLVAGVEPGSVAARAKIKKYDIITKFDGEKIKNGRALNAKMLQKHVGDEAEITVRNVKTGKERTCRVRFNLGRNGEYESDIEEMF